MSQYRDEREALRARVTSLEQELETARAELSELRGDGDAEARIHRLSEDLDAAEAELARLRGDATAGRPPLFFFGGMTGSIGLAVLATMWMFGATVGGGAGARSHCGGGSPFVPGEMMTVDEGTDVPTRAPRCPRVAATGVVTEVTGATEIERGASCDVAVVPLDGQCKARIRCDGTWLFDGFARVSADGRVVDRHPSVEDLDPRIDVDPYAHRAEVSDEDENGSYAIEIDFSEEP